LSLSGRKKAAPRSGFSEQRRITWRLVQQVQQLEPKRQQLERLEPKRQQLALVLVQRLALGLQLGLLFYRKRPGRKLQRRLPKRVTCSFLIP
jgi:hypothetical protein